MNAVSPPVFVARFDAAAKAAQAAEIAFRNNIAAEIARHERTRQFAFRRLGLARDLLAAVSGAENEDAATAAGAAALKRELDWHGETEHRARVLAAFRPVSLAVWAASKDENADAETVDQAFETFEAWHRDAVGTEFFALLDQELPEFPVVEF
ncbi:MAG TPA: hypothetical protein PKZ97_17735 [Azospirillaceae bacterium]|nr:hypothetical protein [Azospirillaceae bacterium]HRQ82956.1 hypothetical protein [Azospirillaceae bacterium]